MIFDVTKFVSLDLETHLIEPGILTPRIVCGSAAVPGEAGIEGHLLERLDAIETAREILESDSIIVGANIAYDMGCLAAADGSLIGPIFKAYQERRVYDVQIAQALHHIAEGNLYQDPATGGPLKGRYSLDRCVEYVLGRYDAKKNDTWRLRYAELDGVPLEQWPTEAMQYPVDDAINTLEVAIAQVIGAELKVGITPGPHRNLGDLAEQAEAAWALHLGAVWGLRTDGDRVVALKAKAEQAHAAFLERFRALGFFDAAGKKNTAAVKRAVVLAYGGGAACECCAGGKVESEKTGKRVNCTACSGTGLSIALAPHTPTDGVRADRDALVESGDTDLAALGDNEPEKVLGTYVPFLETGTVRPISLRPNVLVASGRVSYDGLIQLMPKAGGERECFRFRPGYVGCSVDYSAVELCTWAQVKLWIFGRSIMADTINASGDPGMLHTAFAAQLAGVTTEQMVVALKAADPTLKAWAKKFRDAAKPGNFGFPGGMGAAKFVLAQRKKGAGKTTAADGTVYPGIRFCILLAGAERCGVDKVTEWRRRPTPPICRACVQIVDEQLRPAWFRQWPEAKPYFDWVNDRVGDNGRGELPCFATDRVRGGLDFTNGCNNGFQALASDGAKNALRKLTRECYGVGPEGRDSVLYGTRPIFFVHDEIIAEIPEATAHLAAPRMAEVMVEAMREYVPDVAITAEPALMRFWTKAAETVYRDGKLIPWEDRNV